jgi:hypothetical protein
VGTQDFTVPGWGMAAANIKAAMFVVTGGITDGVGENHARMCIGLAQKKAAVIRQYAMTVSSENLATPQVHCYKGHSSNRCIWLTTGAGTAHDCYATYVDQIDNGVQINWTDAPPAGYMVTVYLFAGTDLQAHVGHYGDAAAAIDEELNVTDPGFPVEQLIVAHSLTNIAFADTTGSFNAAIGIGFADNAGGIPQVCTFANNSNLTSSSVGTARVSALYVARQLGSVATAVKEFHATGFKVWRKLGATAGTTYYYPYLALGYGNTVSHTVQYIQSPIVAEPATVQTSFSYKPQFVLMATPTVVYSSTPSVFEGANTSSEGLAGRGAGVFGVTGFTATEMATSRYTDDDLSAAAAPSAVTTRSYNHNKLFVVADTGMLLYSATFNSFNEFDFKLDYTTIANTVPSGLPLPRVWPMLVIGDTAVPPVAGPIPVMQNSYRQRRS